MSNNMVLYTQRGVCNTRFKFVYLASYTFSFSIVQGKTMRGVVTPVSML